MSGHPAGSRALRRSVGYSTQDAAVYADLTVSENLRYFATLVGAPRPDVDRVLIGVPSVLMILLRYVINNPADFDRFGPMLLGVFPLVVMFVVTSVATLLRDMLIIAGCVAVALAGGAATLRRRTP